MIIAQYLVGSALCILALYACMFGLGAEGIREATEDLICWLLASLFVSILVLAAVFAMCGLSLCGAAS